jgi:hypothetical protein
MDPRAPPSSKLEVYGSRVKTKDWKNFQSCFLLKFEHFFAEIFFFSVSDLTMWQASYDEGDGKIKKFYNLPPDQRLSIYLPSSAITIIRRRRDLLAALVSAGCSHLAIKILKYLDSPSLLASSLVCKDWQTFLFNCFYAAPKFRKSIFDAIFHHPPTIRFR